MCLISISKILKVHSNLKILNIAPRVKAYLRLTCALKPRPRGWPKFERCCISRIMPLTLCCPGTIAGRKHDTWFQHQRACVSSGQGKPGRGMVDDLNFINAYFILFLLQWGIILNAPRPISEETAACSRCIEIA